MWQLMPGQTLRHYSWDQEAYVLYNDLSGDTHLLDAAAMEVLYALRRSAGDAAQLAEALQLDADPQAAVQLAGLLDELRRLALIDRAAC